MRLSRLSPSVLALALCACGGAAPSAVSSTNVAAHHPSPSASARPTAAPAAASTPSAPVIDAAYVADELGYVEPALRSGDTEAVEYAGLGDRQQRAYHLLAAHP